MSGLVEKISDRYAEEIGSLPSIGMLTTFIIFLSAIFIMTDEKLPWLPTIDKIFSKSIYEIFDKDDGIIAKSSLGAVMLAASTSIIMKFIYRTIVKSLLNRLARLKLISNYIKKASEIACEASLSKEKSNGEGEAFITNELTVQRKISQRTHDYSFVVFSILIISISNLSNKDNIVSTLGCLMILTYSEYFLIKIYLTRLFPAICIASAYTRNVAKFGDT